MNGITRLLAITGIGLAAGASIGAGTAQAATGAGHDGTHRVAARAGAHWNDDNDIAGYFDSPILCERVGRIGELRDRWDGYNCYPIRFGFHRGAWALEVSYGDDRGGDGFRPDCPPRHGFEDHFHGGDFEQGFGHRAFV